MGRNHFLISSITDVIPSKPKLYPSSQDYEKVSVYKKNPYLCIAPASVWFTKQFPIEKWIEFINQVPDGFTIYLLGERMILIWLKNIIVGAKNKNMINLVGKLSLTASAALMDGAAMNYTNDSSPLHLASAMNAPVCAIFCSTIPGFWFRPLVRQIFYCRA